MNKEDKMLRLLLSDKRLSSYYEFDPEDYNTIQEALRSNIPIVVAIAKIIKGINSHSDMSRYKEFYKQIYQHLLGM